ncbi:hypothetical protein AB0D94_25355 [Streptomyces sp. NPDC048255]|uniref:hypothetical protein n=1 Tax=Streptomyces sp. NPDC048255 TaxID=3154713 RepID=UPI0033D12BB1
MRTKPLFTAVTAVAVLLTLPACGGSENPALGGIGAGGDTSAGAGTGGGAAGTGDGGPHEGTLENPTKNGGVNGNAPKDGTAFQKLPKAGTIAAAARFVNDFTKCAEITTTKSGYKYWDEDAKYDEKSHSVIERGSCDGGDTRIFMIKDPKAFQAAFKAEIDKEYKETNGGGNPSSGIVVGQDFTVGSTRSTAMAALLKPQAGLLMLNCHPEFTAPSGFRKEPALVKGCVLTDYYKD